MFDIGFSELLLVGLVGLLAFGPERLIKVAREAAFWMRKGRAALASVRAEIDRELQLEELRQLKKAGESKVLEQLSQDALTAFPAKPSEAPKREGGDPPPPA